MPPPGPYVPPAQSTPAQGYNAQQTSQYQSGAVNQNQSNHAHKMPGGALGQMMNQAVTTGKPMLDKLGKTISSRFGNKPAPGPPQHLQSYQNYQSHQGQSNPQAYQQHNQTQSPAPQQQQWQQPAHSPAQPQPPNAYSSTPQQTPFQQSTYATPASGHSGQNNYFPQTAPTPSPQATHTPQNAPSPVYNAQYGQSGGGGLSQQMQQQHGQYGHTQEQYQQQQEQQHNNFAGQQMGVVGNTQNQGYSQGTQPAYSQDNQAPHMANTASKVSAQPPAQSQWGYPPEKQGQLGGLQQTTGSTQPVPQPQWRLPHEQQGQMTGVQHSSHTSPVQQDQQQWNSMSPVSAPGHVSPLASPSPQTVDVQPQIPVNKPIISQPSNSVPQKAAPTEFVAELPGDFENLKLADAPQEQTSPAQTSQYQPYHPPSAQPGSPTNRFSVSRRAVSTSSLPLADPWRFADPITEQPTREFYIIADLLYEALDRKIEPQHTGLLEAPKILKSWVELSDDAQSKCIPSHRRGNNSMSIVTRQCLRPKVVKLTNAFRTVLLQQLRCLCQPVEP